MSRDNELRCPVCGYKTGYKGEVLCCPRCLISAWRNTTGSKPYVFKGKTKLGGDQNGECEEM